MKNQNLICLLETLGPQIPQSLVLLAKPAQTTPWALPAELDLLSHCPVPWKASQSPVVPKVPAGLGWCPTSLGCSHMDCWSFKVWLKCHQSTPDLLPESPESSIHHDWMGVHMGACMSNPCTL